MDRVNDLLRRKFKQTNYSNVKDWKDAAKCPLSLESLTAVILRDKKASLVTALTMGAMLDLPNEAMVFICKESGDNVLWRRFVSTELTDGEKILLEKIRKLNQNKTKLVVDLVDTLGG